MSGEAGEDGSAAAETEEEPPASSTHRDATEEDLSRLKYVLADEKYEKLRLESEMRKLQYKLADRAFDALKSQEAKDRLAFQLADAQLAAMDEREAKKKAQYQLAESKMETLELIQRKKETEFALAEERMKSIELQREQSKLKRRLSDLGLEHVFLDPDAAIAIAGDGSSSSSAKGLSSALSGSYIAPSPLSPLTPLQTPAARTPADTHRSPTDDDVQRLQFVLADEKYARLTLESEMKKLQYKLADSAFDSLKTKDEKDRLAFQLADAQLAALDAREAKERAEYQLADAKLEAMEEAQRRKQAEFQLADERMKAIELERKLQQTERRLSQQLGLDETFEEVRRAYTEKSMTSSGGGSSSGSEARSTAELLAMDTHREVTDEDLARLKYILADERYSKLTLESEAKKLQYQLADKAFDALRTKEEKDRLAFQLADAQLAAIYEREAKQRAEYQLAEARLSAIEEQQRRKETEFALADERMKSIQLERKLTKEKQEKEKLVRRLSQIGILDESIERVRQEFGNNGDSTSSIRVRIDGLSPGMVTPGATASGAVTPSATHRDVTEEDRERLKYVLADEKYEKLRLKTEMKKLQYKLADSSFDSLKTREEKAKLAFQLADAQLAALDARQAKERAEYQLADAKMEAIELKRELQLEKQTQQSLTRRLSQMGFEHVLDEVRKEFSIDESGIDAEFGISHSLDFDSSRKAAVDGDSADEAGDVLMEMDNMEAGELKEKIITMSRRQSELEEEKRRLQYQLAESRMDHIELENRLSHTHAAFLEVTSIPQRGSSQGTNLLPDSSGLLDGDPGMSADLTEFDEEIQLTQEVHSLREEKRELQNRLNKLETQMRTAQSVADTESDSTQAYSDAMEEIHRLKDEMERLRGELNDERLDKIRLTAATVELKERASVLGRRASQAGLNEVALGLQSLLGPELITSAHARLEGDHDEDDDEDDGGAAVAVDDEDEVLSDMERVDEPTESVDHLMSAKGGSDGSRQRSEINRLEQELKNEKQTRVHITRQSRQLKGVIEKLQYSLAEEKLEKMRLKEALDAIDQEMEEDEQVSTDVVDEQLSNAATIGTPAGTAGLDELSSIDEPREMVKASSLARRDQELDFYKHQSIELEKANGLLYNEINDICGKLDHFQRVLNEAVETNKFNILVSTSSMKRLNSTKRRGSREDSSDPPLSGSSASISMATPSKTGPTSYGLSHDSGHKYRLSTLTPAHLPTDFIASSSDHHQLSEPLSAKSSAASSAGAGSASSGLSSPLADRVGMTGVSSSVDVTVSPSLESPPSDHSGSAQATTNALKDTLQSINNACLCMEGLSESLNLVKDKMNSMNADAMRIGVLYVSPYIHVRVLSEFIRNMKASHKARMHERYTNHFDGYDASTGAGGMKPSGQVFNVLYSLLLICLKAKNVSEIPKRSLLKTRLEPYVRYIVDNFLTEACELSDGRIQPRSRLMTVDECTSEFHSWLLSCCEGTVELSLDEQQQLTREIDFLRAQLDRSNREKRHLRQESMAEVSMLKKQLEQLHIEGRIASATESDSDFEKEFGMDATNNTDDNMTDELSEQLKDKVNQLELDLADKDFDLRKARESIAPLKEEVELLRQQLKNDAESSLMNHKRHSIKKMNEEEYVNGFEEEKMSFEVRDNGIESQAWHTWKKRAEEYKKEMEATKVKVRERDESISTMMKWREEEMSEVEQWKIEVDRLKSELSHSEKKHDRSKSIVNLHSDIVLQLTESEIRFEEMEERLTNQLQRVVDEKLRLAQQTSLEIDSLRGVVKDLTLQLVRIGEIYDLSGIPQS